MPQWLMSYSAAQPKYLQRISLLSVQADDIAEKVIRQKRLIEEHDEQTGGNQFLLYGFAMRPFFSMHAGTSLSRFPNPIRFILKILRNFRHYLLPKKLQFTYFGDGMATKARMPFLGDELFREAYLRMRVSSEAVIDPALHWRVHQVVWAVKNCMKLRGDFVECGTGKGLMMSAALTSIKNWDDCGKKLFLFDSFEPYGLDPETGRNSESQGIREKYAESAEKVRLNFSSWANVELIQGQLPESLSNASFTEIAFLHLDLNHAKSEVLVLRRLWNHIVDGGIVILDDFGSTDEQNIALNSLSSELIFDILSTGTSQGIIIKRVIK
jgi:O-methyltransferase